MTMRWPQATYLLAIAFFITTRTTPLTTLLIKHGTVRAAEAESPWLQATPVIEYFDNRMPVVRADYNTDCSMQSGLTRRAAIIPTMIPPQVSEQKIEGCATYTLYGKFISGLLRRNNTDLYGTLSESLRPIPGADKGIRFFNGTSQVSNAYLIPGVFNLLKPVTLADGKIRYDLKPYEPQYLRDKKGDLLNIDHNSVSYSRNGQWLVASTFQGLARINLQTREVFLFDEPFRYTSGLNLGLQTTITPDGRYAVISSSPTGRFRIYDLANCPTVIDATLDRKACRYRDIYAQLAPSAGNPVSILEVRFLSNYRLSFYRQEQSKSQQVIVSAPGGQVKPFEYLALGDSYTSGEGAYNYRDGTDTETNSCRNSWWSYPYLIKRHLELENTESVACAGAIMWDIANDDPNYPGQTKDGLKKQQRQINQILDAFSPGFLPQKDFVGYYHPKVVTLSVGGNNIGFGDKILACLMPGTCFPTYEDRLEILREINSQFDELVKTYEEVKRITAPTTKIYVFGYPEIAKEGSSCGKNVWLDNKEIGFSNILIGQINNLVQAASLRAGVSYIDISKAFYGHRLCEATYSNLAVNGVTAGNDKLDWWIIHGPFAGESFHPTALGHRLYRDTILGQTNNFSGLLTDLALTQSLNEDPIQPLLQAPKSGRPIYSLKYDPSITPGLISKTKSLNVSVAADKWALKPEAVVRISLRSADNNGIGLLASVTANEQGGLTATLPVPQNQPLGPSVLRLDSQSITGESVAIYKTVYVAANEVDIDGDSIVNRADSCLLRPGQSEDHDLDGIDDVCDGFVADPPADTPSQQTNTLQTSSFSTYFVTRNSDDIDNIRLLSSLYFPSVLSATTSPPSTSGGSVTTYTTPEPARIYKTRGSANATKTLTTRLLLFILLLLLAILWGWRRHKRQRLYNLKE